MLNVAGSVLFLLGFLMLWLSRGDDSWVSRACFYLGILLCGMGVWLAFFETGDGVARFLPFLKP